MGAAPLELLLKDELIEEVPNCADQPGAQTRSSACLAKEKQEKL